LGIAGDAPERCDRIVGEGMDGEVVVMAVS
jgi:hypothetical protein